MVCVCVLGEIVPSDRSWQLQEAGSGGSLCNWPWGCEVSSISSPLSL